MVLNDSHRWCDRDIFAKAIDQDADFIIFGLNGHIGLDAAEHPEKTLGVSWQFKFLELVFFLFEAPASLPLSTSYRPGSV